MVIDNTEVAELLEPTVEMKQPFCPAPLGDTVVMEDGWPSYVRFDARDRAPRPDGCGTNA